MEYLITGYWKDDKIEFKDYKVTSTQDSGEDDDIFYYELTEDKIKDAIAKGEDTDLEFVITSYREAT